MLLILLAYLGGVLTIVSPCILPVLPFVFARADRSFARSTLPLLVGMALTFALVATLAAVGGGWAVRANEIGRWAALVLLALFGLALLFPSVSDRLTRPLVALGARLSERAGQPGEKESIGSSLLLGVATGLLWAPCAGPILGIIFTAAAIQGANLNTTLLLLAYALGAATSLALALLVGGKLFGRMKKSLGASERIRQVLGALVLVGVAAIALVVWLRGEGSDVPATAPIAAYVVASIGMGFAYPRTGVSMLASATDEDRGFNSSALTVADSLGAALALSVSGIAYAAAVRADVDPFPVVYLLAVAIGAVGALAGRRAGQEASSSVG